MPIRIIIIYILYIYNCIHYTCTYQYFMYYVMKVIFNKYVFYISLQTYNAKYLLNIFFYLFKIRVITKNIRVDIYTQLVKIKYQFTKNLYLN